MVCIRVTQKCPVMAAFVLDSCITQRHHVYIKNFWTPSRGGLSCVRETGNANDLYTVAVQRSGVIVNTNIYECGCADYLAYLYLTE